MAVLPFKIPESIEIQTLKDNYGKFILSPLERGYGVTIGHAMKRVLLSSIQGAAIYSIKIDGVLHEFSSIAGVKEDVAVMILNLKQVRLNLSEGRTSKVTVNLKGPKIFTAKDIEDSSGGEVKVFNPDFKIATLNEEAEFSIELNIRIGRGYVSSDGNRDDNDPIGTIAIDSIFSPIIKVSYDIENTRVGDKTDYEKLSLEVFTDASISPEEAITYAGQILRDHINLFIKFEVEEDTEGFEDEDPDILKKRNLLKMSIDELELSVRSYNCLSDAKVKTIGDLVRKKESEMLKFRNFGKKSLAELNKVLKEKGLEFGMDVDKYLNDTQSKKKK
ncbi:MAG TPA: DNA-directed RNA polymerase subunit alpha [Clostridiales bacterium]|nr:DNA-directed RNA polymerase subunit alpha [Clostridiales bacterium]HQP70225.1 DNA-directed RNA polymerase subunit alpha [Clostridiales bacterium]